MGPNFEREAAKISLLIFVLFREIGVTYGSSADIWGYALLAFIICPKR